ncbi:MAG: chloride channel protein, partial [bacterium]|nr:chloride channel protein [bacterium]
MIPLGLLAKFKNLKEAFLRIDSRTIYFYSFLIGCLTGGVAILFYLLIHKLTYLLFDQGARLPLVARESGYQAFGMGDSSTRYLLVLVLPAVGGLLVGLLTKYWGKEAKGTGVDTLLDSFHNHSGQMRRRTPFLKFTASTLTLSTGGSAGKEGPMALIGAGIGSLVGRWVKMGARAKRTLLLAGSAGGLGAIFRAPLGGAITAVEVLYKEDFEADALLPCIIASVTAYTIFSSVVGFGHILAFEANLFASPIQLIFYVLLGLFCSGASYVFIWLFRSLRSDFFKKIKIPLYLKPAL